MHESINQTHFYIGDKVQTKQGMGTVTEFKKDQHEVKVWIPNISSFAWFLNNELKRYDN